MTTESPAVITSVLLASTNTNNNVTTTNTTTTAPAYAATIPSSIPTAQSVYRSQSI